MKIIEVEWEDSCSIANQWMKPNGDLEPSLCKSVGYLVSKNKKRIVIAQNYNDESGEVHNQFIIPRGCVIKIKEVVIER